MRTLQLITASQPDLLIEMKADLATYDCDIFTVMELKGVDVGKYNLRLGDVMNLGQARQFAIDNQLQLILVDPNIKEYLVEDGGILLSTYGIITIIPELIYANKEFTDRALVSTHTLGAQGLTAVRYKITMVSAPNRTASITLTAEAGGQTFTQTIRKGENAYWGDEDGFDIAAQYSAETDFTAKFDQPGLYGFDIQLVGAEDGRIFSHLSQSIYVQPETL